MERWASIKYFLLMKQVFFLVVVNLCIALVQGGIKSKNLNLTFNQPPLTSSSLQKKS